MWSSYQPSKHLSPGSCPTFTSYSSLTNWSVQGASTLRCGADQLLQGRCTRWSMMVFESHAHVCFELLPSFCCAATEAHTDVTNQRESKQPPTMVMVLSRNDRPLLGAINGEGFRELMNLVARIKIQAVII